MRAGYSQVGVGPMLDAAFNPADGPDPVSLDPLRRARPFQGRPWGPGVFGAGGQVVPWTGDNCITQCICQRARYLRSPRRAAVSFEPAGSNAAK